MRSGLKRRLEYSDYAAIPPDGKRYEILRGDLSVTPAPSPQHQRISRRLLVRFEEYFHARSVGEVFYAPIDVILSPEDVVQPDMIVVADPEQISQRGIEGPPLLVVEILSPSTREYDRSVKARRYAELGVRHYWLVDPEARQIECHRLTSGAFRRVVAAEGEGTLIHPDWKGLAIELEALWR